MSMGLYVLSDMQCRSMTEWQHFVIDAAFEAKLRENMRKRGLIP